MSTQGRGPMARSITPAPSGRTPLREPVELEVKISATGPVAASLDAILADAPESAFELKSGRMKL